ncbi:MAG: hypothetical protein ACEY3E_05010 [Candidatus Tisiphia sp.]
MQERYFNIIGKASSFPLLSKDKRFKAKELGTASLGRIKVKSWRVDRRNFPTAIKLREREVKIGQKI